jgi:hypothetical protein
MQKFRIANNIHDEMYFTFETSWVGNEYISFEKNQLLIPIVNITIENPIVLKYFNLKNSDIIYIERSYFEFNNVSVLKKEIAIHSKDNKGFVNRLNNINIIEGRGSNKFYLGSMGIFQDYTYDGSITVECESCYYVLPDNFEYRTEFRSMNEYNPFTIDWEKIIKNDL